MVKRAMHEIIQQMAPTVKLAFLPIFLYKLSRYHEVPVEEMYRIKGITAT